MNAQPELEYPSEPIAGDTAATVELVGSDWRADEDWRRFRETCLSAVTDQNRRDWMAGRDPRGYVNPNDVRRRLTIDDELTIAPRRLSAFWARATSKKGFLDNTSEWTVNDDHKGGNAGKPIRLRRLRSP